MMEKIPFTSIHAEKLFEYGLQHVPLGACTCLRFEPGEMVVQESEPISTLFMVMSGRSKVYRTAVNGKMLILCYFISDGTIGGMELLSNQTTAIASMTAVSPFECLSINFQICAKEMKTNSVFLSKLGMEAAVKLMQNTDNLLSAALCSGEQRLCAYILQASYRGIFNDILTDVSCLIGISYRHVFRLLGQLCSEGILEKRVSGYYIAKRDLLMRRAEG